MGRVTPSKAKNAIRRALLAEIDGTITQSEKQAAWRFFGNACAYCGCLLDPDGREGHMDHLTARADGGRGHLGNIVLACRICNGDEKRDMPWQQFLRLKCSSQLFAQRHSRIIEWSMLNGRAGADVPEALRHEAETHVQAAISAFEHALANIRRIKIGGA
jgi:hypothetical protein